MTTALPEFAPRTLGGRYELIEVIARGGSSIVTRGRDKRVGRAVAVKQLLDPRDIEGVTRLEHEATMLARCAHSGVVGCYDLGVEGDSLYLVMQYVEGANLAQRLASGGPIAVDTTVEWALALTRALAHVHERGVVHGDLKPQHVILGERGAVTLVDFGRAHLDGESAEATGAPAYAAPEVQAGRPTTRRSDVYSLGIVLQRLIERASMDEWDAEAAARAAHLNAVTALLLAADPARRPAHAGLVADALADATEARSGRPG